MMPSPLIYTYGSARHPCRLSAGTAQARITALHSIAVARPILSSTRRSLVHTDACDHAPPQADRGDRLNPTSASPNLRQNPHNARGTAHAYVPRFRALARTSLGLMVRRRGSVLALYKRYGQKRKIGEYRTSAR